MSKPVFTEILITDRRRQAFPNPEHTRPPTLRLAGGDQATAWITGSDRAIMRSHRECAELSYG
jgi:hypothetical protein